MPVARGKPKKFVKSVSERVEVEQLQKKRQELQAVTSKRFSDLPLSKKTGEGLKRADFIEMTDIQALTLPYSLSDKDILAAAKTGSGKTLAFLIPVLEKLFVERWSTSDGLGALILTPTRELAVQIFEVLKSIGGLHDFSAGLAIGGKDLKFEREVIGRMNILVATPGRLLQHLDQSYSFEGTNLKILVLDEADRILDMGFSKTVTAIIESLPRDRQTLLFSATQTASVDALSRLSLQDPVHLSAYKSGVEMTTPENLRQTYVICKLQDKLEHLYAFLKLNLKSKIIVFMSSCKQVRFLFESFCKLQPGIQVMQLHGRQKQHQRLEVYEEFCRRKAAVLFCTDIASRGLDFPAVDHVVHLDCPESVETYIHRSGRTARLECSGHSHLFLLRSEALFLEQLTQKEIKLKETKTSELKKKWNITTSLKNICSQYPEIKELAQKAVSSYLRSIHLQPNKSVFKMAEYEGSEIAASFGLHSAPNVKLLPKDHSKNLSRDVKNISSDEEEEFGRFKPAQHDFSDDEEVNAIVKPNKKKRKFAGTKISFDEEQRREETVGEDYLQAEASRMAAIDREDKEAIKRARRQRKLEMKASSDE